jgi:phosphatidate phosphatase LPIN
MFPPIHRKWTPEFTDFNYWKVPVQDFPLPDLSPPSPALSARSDTSNQSALARLRKFSLMSRPSTSRLSPSPLAEDLETGNASLRQMSSFEKLSSTLGFGQTTLTTVGSSRRSMSPASSTSYESDDEDDLELGRDGRRRRIERRRSMTSMPGTLDEIHFGIDEGEDESRSFGDGEQDEEEMEDEMLVDDDVGNEAFDEDLLAAGEMKNVPFL